MIFYIGLLISICNAISFDLPKSRESYQPDSIPIVLDFDSPIDVSNLYLCLYRPFSWLLLSRRCHVKKSINSTELIENGLKIQTTMQLASNRYKLIGPFGVFKIRLMKKRSWFFDKALAKSDAFRISDKLDLNTGSYNHLAINFLASLEEHLKNTIVGQVGPINSISSSIRRKYEGWSNEERPLTFLFLGSSGVGKTEMVTVLRFKI